MEYRPLEITVISANDLKDVGRFSKMDVYVVVSLSDDPRSNCRTPIDKDGGKSPKWNHKVKLFVNENYLSRNPKLIFNIRADRTFSDKDVGEVSIPVKELLDSSSTISAERSVEYKVITPKGKSEGRLKFSYKFGEKSKQPVNSTKNTEPVAAYPAFAGPSKAQPGYAQPPSAAAYQAPPGVAYQAPPGVAYQAPPSATTGNYGYPPQGYGGYPPPGPPPRGYGGYPPAAYGGYPPPAGFGGYPPPVGYGGYMSQQPPPRMMQAPQKKKKNNFGLGMGAGLLGGLLVGDMISDMGDNMDAYDAGYDDGFDDSAFGF